MENKLVELMRRLHEGSINRRAFLRAARAMGLSVGLAEVLAACGPGSSAMVTPTAYKPGNQDPTNVAAAIQFQEKFGSMDPPAESSKPLPPVTEKMLVPPSSAAGKATWMCVACGQQFSSAEALQDHALQMHAKRLPEIKRVEKPTYSEFITGPVPRFDERNTAFSRSMWEEAYAAKIKQAVGRFMAKVEQKSPEEKMAMLEGQALVAGAIYVDDTAGSLHEKYTGYMGHMKDVGGLYGWEDPVNTTRLPVADPVKMSARIKAVASFFGASLVGITRVNPSWVYSNYFERSSGNSGPVDMPYPFAIMMAVEMGWDEINQSPGYPASAAAALGYSRMAEIAASLAKYIRMLGYPALPSGNDTGQNIPLAIDAGLGEHGRSGLLLTPQFGPRQRLCKVFTSLPLQPDQPIDFGIVKYCQTCHACATSCPARAIPMGDRTDVPTSISNRTGIKRWTVKVADCLLFWRENGTDCGNCIASCPWALRSTRDWLET